MKKKTAAILLILSLLMVLFFTLQEPTKSRDLSEAVRAWLRSAGIEVGYKELRSNIHILEYFVVGLAVCGFCRSRGWKLWTGAVGGCVIGVLDEGVKVLLPQREFSKVDLVKDWIGIGIAICLVFVCIKHIAIRPDNVRYHGKDEWST